MVNDQLAEHLTFSFLYLLSLCKSAYILVYLCHYLCPICRLQLTLNLQMTSLQTIFLPVHTSQADCWTPSLHRVTYIKSWLKLRSCTCKPLLITLFRQGTYNLNNYFSVIFLPLETCMCVLPHRDQH